MKASIFLVLIAMAIPSLSFAQRANNKWFTDNVQTVSGSVTDNQRPSGFLKSDDGKTYRINLGPVWFWEQNNFSLELSAVTIKGGVREINGEYNIYPFEITQNSKTMTFTDDKGIPKWGNSTGMRNGNGKGNRGNCRRNGDVNDNDNGNCCRDGNGNGNRNGNGWGNRGNCPGNK
jgi:hypothetical protein